MTEYRGVAEGSEGVNTYSQSTHQMREREGELMSLQRVCSQINEREEYERKMLIKNGG